MLGDEALTPDSSRFWPADDYEPGRPQPSFDKQFVRDWCEASGWDKTEPGPELPDDVVAGTRARYVEAFERLTEIAFDEYLADPQVVLAMRATVLVRPKAGILDPQGEAVRGSLRKLDFPVARARVGRIVDLELETTDLAEARPQVERMCAELLANPLIESVEIHVGGRVSTARRSSPSSSFPARTTTGTRCSRSSALGADARARLARRRRELPPATAASSSPAGSRTATTCAAARSPASRRRWTRCASSPPRAARARHLQRLPDPLRSRPVARGPAAEPAALVRLPRRRGHASSGRIAFHRPCEVGEELVIPVKHGRETGSPTLICSQSSSRAGRSSFDIPRT